MKPIRVQLSRKKGWRMPPNTVKVARPSKWGNPFLIGARDPSTNQIMAATDVVKHFEAYVDKGLLRIGIRNDLRGKNLACFCKLTEPCHADVLLRIANS